MRQDQGNMFYNTFFAILVKKLIKQKTRLNSKIPENY